MVRNDRGLPVESHEARNPGGFVSEQTSEQVMAYYRGVQDWVRRGHEAESSPAYRIDVRLPVDVPGPAGAWRERPPAHLEGMRRAGETIGVRAEAAVRELLEHTDPAEHPGAAETLRALIARAKASARSVDEMWSTEPPERLRADLEREVRSALTAHHHAGQLAALPALIAAQQTARGGR